MRTRVSRARPASAVTAALAAALATAAAASATASAASFQRVATWPVYTSLPAGTPEGTKTAAEILARGKDGTLLLFTDSPFGSLGFVDITDPAAPKPLGRLNLGGEPTSVAVAGNRALVAVNTSPSFTAPSGHVAVVGLDDRTVAATCDVKGQPDSVALSPDGRFLAVAVENERDESLNKGALPQLPGGHLAILTLGADGMPANCDAATIVPLTGLAAIAPEDPEPEYVAINGRNIAAVTLQENNHIVLVDLATATVTGHFPAGTADLAMVDVTTDKVVRPDGSLKGVKREPDAIAWLDDDRLVTADEGDYEGGSRGFTIFDTGGSVLFEAGSAPEHLATRVGHYPEKRAGKKGTEPEGVAVATYGSDRFLFVGLERANLVAVYRDRGPGAEPEFVQVLPTGIAPEGILPIPERGLLAVANEADDPGKAVRSTVTLYRLTDAPPVYPTIVSADVDSAPIGWGALSGLAADPRAAGMLYAVPDSAYAQSRVFTIDATATPARITAATVLMKDGKTVDYDLEGVAVAADGGFWLVSEGNPEKGLHNLLIRAKADGTVDREIALPAEVAAGAGRFGFEGVAAVGSGADERVYAVIQREWKDDGKGRVRIGRYSPADGRWDFVRYPLDAVASPAGGWIGLSDIAPMADGRFAILERDNQGGPNAAVKRIYAVDLAGAAFAPAGTEPPVVEKTLILDVLPHLTAPAGWTPDKVEGLTVGPDGTAYLVTDNDGVDDASGETQFIVLGPLVK
ncbi:esterase-like activity of phytase family protein [Azospirillum halopraeferens]|uniref:esterase-like activity of phytase family protein n=1 Tax=Azospirillum halopraeferens TaxID=34010 RepID=UPI000416327B|nr:esterase-like activity of phytase family protein [Azospirillum halopraeferens]